MKNYFITILLGVVIALQLVTIFTDGFETSILLAIVALQLIMMSAVFSNNKNQGVSRGVHHPVKRAGTPGGDSRGDKGPAVDPRRGVGVNNIRKPADNRGVSKPPQSGARQPGAQGQGNDRGQPAAIDPMEMSLRDINRKLKNAEREQENARKKIQESGKEVIGGGRDVSREPGRDGGSRDVPRDRPPRVDRNDRGGRLDSRGGRREFNRVERVSGRPDRPQRDFDAAAGFMQTSTSGSEPVAPAPPPDIQVSDAGIGDADLQHGRKFTAKRRPLPQEPAASEAAEAPATVQAAESPITAPAATEQTVSPETATAPAAAPVPEPVTAPEPAAPAAGPTPESEPQDQSDEPPEIQYGR